MTAAEDTRTLATLIRRKRDCLARLCALSQSAASTANGDEASRIITVLAGKRQLLSELRTLEQALAPFRRQSSHERAWQSEEERTRCAAMLAECETLWAQIIDEEARGERTLRSWSTTPARTTTNCTPSSTARTAYALHAGDGLTQLDLD